MKKLFILMLSIFTFFFSRNVIAQSSEKLVMENKNNPYYFRVWKNNTDTDKLTFYNLNGDVAYCVDPGVPISSNIYFEESIDNIHLTIDQLERIKLIGYYGYEYPNHRSDRYRLATQALIWETVKDLTTEFWSGPNRTGVAINVDFERNEILNLVNNHKLVPEFNEIKTISINSEAVFKDINQVLENFTIINNNDDLEVFKVDNELHVKGNKTGEYVISLVKEKYDNKTTIFYVGSDGVSQRLMKLRIDSEIKTDITFSIVSGKVFLKKLDNETKTNKVLGSRSLEGAIYGIYDEKNNLVETFKTNEFGEIESSELKFGNYFLQEIKPSYGYSLDPIKYNFTLDNDKNYEIIEVYENPLRGEIIIVKSIEENTSFLKGEKDIVFEIFLKGKDEVYKKITTDEDGIAKIDLPYGEYVFHQVNSTQGYYKVEDFEVIIDEKKENTYKLLQDQKVVGKLEILKKDSNTNLGLSNALIEIYKVGEEETYIYEGYTDNDGKLVVNNLGVGDYRIIEKVAPVGYQLKEEEYYVTVSDVQNEISLEIKNDVIEVEVPNTGLEDKSKKNLSLCVLIGGVFFILVAKLKKDDKLS